MCPTLNKDLLLLLALALALLFIIIDFYLGKWDWIINITRQLLVIIVHRPLSFHAFKLHAPYSLGFVQLEIPSSLRLFIPVFTCPCYFIMTSMIINMIIEFRVFFIYCPATIFVLSSISVEQVLGATIPHWIILFWSCPDEKDHYFILVWHRINEREYCSNLKDFK